MRKQTLMVLFGVSFSLVTLIGCGGAGGICEELIIGFCDRRAECASSDPATQAEYAANCRRSANPTATCDNLSPSQEREMDILSNTGCQESFDACTCSSGRMNCGSTCNTAVYNGMTSLGFQ